MLHQKKKKRPLLVTNHPEKQIVFKIFQLVKINELENNIKNMLEKCIIYDTKNIFNHVLGTTHFIIKRLYKDQGVH